MPTKAKIYIGLVIILGFALLAGSVALRSDFPDMPRYISYLLLALLASTFKVRLPGITGTISVNFLLILIGIADFTFTETITMGCAAIVIQCVWGAKRRPQLIQVLFNVAALALSIGVAYQVAHYTLTLARAESLSCLHLGARGERLERHAIDRERDFDVAASRA